MREEVAPALRELGLTGTFRQFRYAIGGYECFLRVQKSQWSDAGHVDFTVYLSLPFLREIELFALMTGAEVPPRAWWVVRRGAVRAGRRSHRCVMMLG